MYKSPIEIAYGQMQLQIEKEVYRAVQRCNVNVDKDELVKALSYDRDQYYKGYRDAMNAIVRCKDCRLYLTDTTYCQEHNKGYCELDGCVKNKSHFCGFGDRKDDGE